MEYSETWCCTYYVSFGRGDSSEDIDLEVECTKDEYRELLRLEYAQTGDLDDGIFAEDLFDSEDQIDEYEKKTVEDLPSLSAFVDRVAAAVQEAVDEDCQRFNSDAGETIIKPESVSISWSYGAIE